MAVTSSRISAAEKKFIHEGVELGVRADGRTNLEYRFLTVESGILPQANGSARVRLDAGGTDILAAVKAEVGEPLPGKGKEGRVECSVECWSSASPQFEGRGAADINAELTRSVSRILKAPGAMDLSALSIVGDKRCWVVYVDVVVFDSGGNILDGITAAVYAALHDTRLPKLLVTPGEEDLGDAEIEIDEDPTAGVELDTSGVPLCVTFFQIGKHFVVDVDVDEEHCTMNRVVLAVNRKGNLLAVNTAGTQPITAAGLHACVQAALGIGADLFKRMASAIAAAPLPTSDTIADYLWKA